VQLGAVKDDRLGELGVRERARAHRAIKGGDGGRRRAGGRSGVEDESGRARVSKVGDRGEVGMDVDATAAWQVAVVLIHIP
jgi:hypothetical protein